MQILRFFGALVAIVAVAYGISLSLPPFTGPRAASDSRPHDSQSLTEALQGAAKAQDVEKNRLEVIRDLMKEIDGQSRPSAAAAQAPPPAPAVTVVGQDPAALDRVLALKNLTPETKAEILRNYRQTGYLPPTEPGPPGPRRETLPDGSFVEATGDARAPSAAITKAPPVR